MKINVPIAFSSKIKFVPLKEFDRILAEEEERKGSYEVTSVTKMKRAKRAYTLAASACISGGFRNDKAVVVFHFLYQKSQDDEKLRKKALNLMKHGALNGLITGGLVKSAVDEINQTYFDRVRKIFDELKINTSILWGQKTDFCATDLLYSPDSDTWFLKVHNHGKLIKSAQDIKDTFKIIRIADGDEVWIGDRKIDKGELV